jgi:hypothetical protein
MVARAGIFGDERIRFWNVFELLTRESLEFNPAQAARRFSGICRDGTPWQFCAAIGATPTYAVRYLTEVGSPGVALGRRTELAVERITRVLEVLGASDRRETVRILARLCPRDDDHIAGLWVGFAMDGRSRPRARVYANNGWGDQTARWLRLISGLRALDAGGFGASLQPLLPLLEPKFSPAGLAVTLPSTPPLCKLYLRPLGPPWSAVRAVAREILGSNAGAFVAAIEDGLEQSLETLPERSVLLSVAGSAAGGPLDVKFDLCGHCLFEDDHRPARVVERLGRSFGLDTSTYDAMSEDVGGFGARIPHHMVAFVGVGASAAGEHRMNVYFTPPALH